MEKKLKGIRKYNALIKRKRKMDKKECIVINYSDNSLKFIEKLTSINSDYIDFIKNELSKYIQENNSLKLKISDFEKGNNKIKEFENEIIQLREENKKIRRKN